MEDDFCGIPGSKIQGLAKCVAMNIYYFEKNYFLRSRNLLFSKINRNPIHKFYYQEPY
jgi:hypothetical protein